MDNDEYLKRLKELAVLERANKFTKPKIITETIIDEFGEEQTIETIQEPNKTIAPVIKNIKPKSQLCELGCGDIVTNQVIEKRLATYPKNHWRTRCQNCNMYLHPTGEGFCDSIQVANEYRKWFYHNLKDDSQ